MNDENTQFTLDNKKQR